MDHNTRTTDPIVVISWWSNAIALACLRDLATHAPRQRLYVVQAGKSPEQKEKFRRLLPPSVTEVPYPDDGPGEHARVLRAVVFESFKDAAGVWFLDHDVFLAEPLDPWLDEVEAVLRRSALCLCLPMSTYGQSITQPAFWISPARLPSTIDSFDPIPFREHACFRRPSEFRGDGELVMPVKDTMWAARDELQATGKVVYFPVLIDSGGGTLPRFPTHTHLGGLSTLAGPLLPREWSAWMKATASRFLQFFDSCPPEWRAIEDDVLLRRCQEFYDAADVDVDRYTFELFPRQDLSMRIDRRGALATFSREIGIRKAQAEGGGAANKLSALGSLADEGLALVRPATAPGWSFVTSDEFLCAREETQPHAAMKLFPASLPAAALAHAFNGRTTLAALAAELAATTGWDAARSFAYARGVFLYLVQHGICLPA